MRYTKISTEHRGKYQIDYFLTQLKYSRLNIKGRRAEVLFGKDARSLDKQYQYRLDAHTILDKEEKKRSVLTGKPFSALEYRLLDALIIKLTPLAKKYGIQAKVGLTHDQRSYGYTWGNKKVLHIRVLRTDNGRPREWKDMVDTFIHELTHTKFSNLSEDHPTLVRLRKDMTKDAQKMGIYQIKLNKVLK